MQGVHAGLHVRLSSGASEFCLCLQGVVMKAAAVPVTRAACNKHLCMCAGTTMYAPARATSCTCTSFVWFVPRVGIAVAECMVVSGTFMAICLLLMCTFMLAWVATCACLATLQEIHWCGYLLHRCCPCYIGLVDVEAISCICS